MDSQQVVNLTSDKAAKSSDSLHEFNGTYTRLALDHIAFPMGGFGAGMICLEGAGALSHVSLRHRPEMRHEPDLYAAISVKAPASAARVLEGPVPKRKRAPNLSI